MTGPDLFPHIEPYRAGHLPVDDLHKLYWEESGNPRGKPIVFLHGGPGAPSNPVYRRFFDPAAYRIIIFDQRGVGQSKPFGETRDNTTKHLIADLEKLREFFKVEKWHLFGGSWGSTLALAYAQEHPSRVSGMIMRGIFLFRRWEIEWFFKGMGAVFPDANEKFLAYLPPHQRADPLKGYYPLLMNGDPAVHMPAATLWTWYETVCSSLLPVPPEMIAPDPIRDLGMARMEAHYFTHSLFEPDNKLLRDIPKIRHIPAVLIQGRYDMVCPATSAWDLHKAWPESELIIVPDAGHSALEPSIRSELVKATEKFKTLR